jgi:hypothetical protein
MNARIYRAPRIVRSLGTGELTAAEKLLLAAAFLMCAVLLAIARVQS